jgi:hypothetical protein
MNRSIKALVMAALAVVGVAATMVIGASSAPTANCGEGCSTSDAGVAHMKINGDHFNIGDRVWLGYYQLNSRRLIQGYWVNATPHPNFPGGSFGHRTDMLNCGKGAVTAYIRAYDQTSARWSSQLNIHTGCVHP